MCQRGIRELKRETGQQYMRELLRQQWIFVVEYWLFNGGLMDYGGPEQTVGDI